jgi:hypothetical protein
VKQVPQHSKVLSNNLKDFFGALGKRSTNEEVALSDVTYALLSGNSLFGHAFAALFEEYFCCWRKSL